MQGNTRLTKIAQQAHIIPLHSNTRADQHTPRDSFGVQLDTLPQRHPMLFIGRAARIMDDFVHALCVRDIVFGREVERVVILIVCWSPTRFLRDRIVMLRRRVRHDVLPPITFQWRRGETEMESGMRVWGRGGEMARYRKRNVNGRPTVEISIITYGGPLISS